MGGDSTFLYTHAFAECFRHGIAVYIKMGTVLKSLNTSYGVNAIKPLIPYMRLSIDTLIFLMRLSIDTLIAFICKGGGFANTTTIATPEQGINGLIP